MAKGKMEDVVALTSRIMHGFYSGKVDVWFDRLCPDSIWVGAGEPSLFGAEAIKSYFQNYKNPQGLEIFSEEYYPLTLGANAAVVNGRLAFRIEGADRKAVTLLTMVYRLVGGKTKVAYHHMSYEFFETPSGGPDSRVELDASTRRFIRQLLLEPQKPSRVPISIGKQTVYLDPYTVLYVKSNAHKTELTCIDRVLDCSMPMGQLAPLLGDSFYPVRRGYLVNSQYVTAVRYCEVELLFGTVIPVPAPIYSKVKRELNALITGNAASTK